MYYMLYMKHRGQFLLSQCDSYMIFKYSAKHCYAVAFYVGLNDYECVPLHFCLPSLNAAVNDFLERTIFSFQVICKLSQHSGFFLTAESLICSP